MRKIKVLSAAMSVLVSVSFLGACAGSGEEKVNDNGKKLYAEEKKLIQSYIDSLTHAPDSVDVSGLIERYQESLTQLNMKYPAETDLLLTPGENDTIFMLTKKLMGLAEKHGMNLDTIIVAQPDTVARPELPEQESPSE